MVTKALGCSDCGTRVDQLGVSQLCVIEGAPSVFHVHPKLSVAALRMFTHLIR